MKRMYLALLQQEATVKVDGKSSPVILPEGCKGILLAFSHKKYARKYFGKKVRLQEITQEPEGKC